MQARVPGLNPLGRGGGVCVFLGCRHVWIHLCPTLGARRSALGFPGGTAPVAGVKVLRPLCNHQVIRSR